MRKLFILFPFLIILLVFVHFISSYKILEQSEIYRLYDQLDYLKASYSRATFSAEGLFSRLYQASIFEGRPGFMRPFFLLVGTIFLKLFAALNLFSNEMLLILTTNSFFLIILMISIYGIIKIIYEDEDLALLGAFFISFTPIVYSVIRVYMTDFPLMSMVTLAIFVLLKTNDFKSRFYSFVAGIVFFLSQATKETAVIFIFMPTVFYFIYSLKENKPNHRIIFNNFLIFLATVACLTLFYLPRLNIYLSEGSYQISQVYGGTSSMNYYFTSFPWAYFHPLLFSVLLFGFIIYLKNFRLMKKEVLLLIWLFFPLILFSFSSNKSIRFIYPVISPFLIASIGGIRRNKVFSKWLFLLLIIISIFQWCVLTYFPQFLQYSSRLEKYRPYYLRTIPNNNFMGLPSVVVRDKIMIKYDELSRDLIKTIKLYHDSKVDVRLFCFFGSSELYSAIENSRDRLWNEYYVPIVFSHLFALSNNRRKISSALEEFNQAGYILYREDEYHLLLENDERKELYMKLVEQLKEDIDTGRLRLLRTFSLEGKAVHLYGKSSDK